MFDRGADLEPTDPVVTDTALHLDGCVMSLRLIHAQDRTARFAVFDLAEVNVYRRGEHGAAALSPSPTQPPTPAR